MNRDLTVGRPSKVLWEFCLPLFGSVIFQQLYNIADSFVAGKFVGEAALAAVGNSYEITLIFIAIAMGSNMGCSVTVSRLFGGKRYGEMKTAVYTALIAGGVLCALMMGVGLGFGGSLMRWIHTPENIWADSKLYLDIYVLGLPFVFFYNLSTGIFTALGDSRTPFWFLAVSSVANIFMDILFTTALRPVFPRGVDGVAWATFLCQGVSCILAVAVMFRRFRKIEVQQRVPLFSLPLLGQIATVAVPSILQQSFISVGNILVQGVINGFGSGVIAGYAAAIKLNNLVITSLTTIGNGISNYTAQNLGAGKKERIRAGFYAGMKMELVIVLPLMALYFLGGRLLMGLFLDNPTEDAMQTGILFLRIVAPFYGICAAKLVSDGTLKGTGRMNAFMVGTFSDLLLRVTLSRLFAAQWGSVGIWLSWPVGWTVGAILSVSFTRDIWGRQKPVWKQ